MRPSPDRRPAGMAAPRLVLAPLPRALALLALTSSLGACSMFHFGQKPGATPDNAPTIQTLLKPALYQRMLKDREILTSATLNDDHYAFYAVMAVHSEMARTRRILTDYSLYSKIIPYVDKTDYSPITRILDVQGGILGWHLHSLVRFTERSERWIQYEIVAGHFRGLTGDMFFEPAPENAGTLVYFRGGLTAQHWPPKFIIERGAEIVFGFTANRMRKYVESNEDRQKDGKQAELPQPRGHL